MRKSFISAAAIASAALLLAACGSNSGGGTDASETPTADDTASAEETPAEGGEESSAPAVRDPNADLVIWADAGKAPGVEQIAKAYGEANGITVTVQTIVDVRKDFVTANEAGNGPDVVVGAHDWIGQLVANGSIDPLTLSADSLGAYSEQAVNAARSGGQLYGLPYGIESLLLYCNNEYAPGPYDTLDAVIAAGQAAKDAGSVESALNVPSDVTGDAYHMQPLFTSAGGYLFGVVDGEYDPNDLGIATPEGIAAAEKISTLGDAGSKVLSTAITGANAISLFAEGKAACLISGPWALNDVEAGLGADGYNIQAIPGFEGMNPAAPFMGVNVFYVASNGANKAFGQDFIANGVNSEASMEIMQDATRQPSAMTSVLDKADPIVKTFGEAAANAQPMPAIPAMDAVWGPLGTAYANIIGGKPAAAEMESAAKTIQDAIANS